LCCCCCCSGPLFAAAVASATANVYDVRTLPLALYRTSQVGTLFLPPSAERLPRSIPAALSPEQPAAPTSVALWLSKKRPGATEAGDEEGAEQGAESSGALALPRRTYVQSAGVARAATLPGREALAGHTRPSVWRRQWLSSGRLGSAVDVTVLLTRKDPARRAYVLARGYSRGECRRHRIHSKHQNHKGTRRPKTRVPTQAP
jgi:hypothetical protein